MKRLGLALGSGGARGLAHLGVLRALRETGLPVAAVAGTSMGALVGLALAAGRDVELREAALVLDWKSISRLLFQPRWPRGGLVDGARVIAFLRRYIQDRPMEELAIPSAAVATDLLNGDEVVIRSGSVLDAIRASIAVPGLFTPVAREGRLLVDGGFVNPVPVNVVRELGADVVLAVDVSHYAPLRPAKRSGAVRGHPPPGSGGRHLSNRSATVRRLEVLLRRAAGRMKGLAERAPWLEEVRHDRRREETPGLFDVLGMAIRIAESQIAEMRFRLDPPDLILRPSVGRYFFMDFGAAQEIEQAGYEAAKARMDELRRLCGRQ